MTKSGAIGLFDSGIGGLSVAMEVYRQLPAEATVYYGDTAHVPYGPRSTEELVCFADRIVAFLEGQAVKYIIFACNTSSSLSLPVLKERYQVPMIGVVHPGAAEALRKTENGRVGVIATEATIQSCAYEKELKRLNKDIVVYSRAAPRLVPLVEAGETDTPEAAEVVREYLYPLREAGVDTLILGCTHYPFLTRLITGELGPGVQLVDPASAAVQKAREEICRLGLAVNGALTAEHRFFVSGVPESFRSAACRFLGKDIGPVKRVEL